MKTIQNSIAVMMISMGRYLMILCLPLIMILMTWWFLHDKKIQQVVPHDVDTNVLQAEQQDILQENVAEQKILQKDKDGVDSMQDTVMNKVVTDHSDKAPIEDVVIERILLPESECFVTMSSVHAGYLENNVQELFEMLIGHNIDNLLDLIVQSNNNILSKESCKSCGIHTLLKKVSKHQKLSKQEILILQRTMKNLYTFTEMMKKFNHKNLLTIDQDLALQSLNVSKKAQEKIELQVQRAKTMVALQALQDLDSVERNG